jgi:hypothetical protein
MDEGIAAMNAALEAAASATPLQSTSDGDLTDGKKCSVQKCPLEFQSQPIVTEPCLPNTVLEVRLLEATSKLH